MADLTPPEPVPDIVLVRRDSAERAAYREGALAAIRSIRRRLPPKVRGKYWHREIVAQLDLAEQRFLSLDEEVADG